MRFTPYAWAKLLFFRDAGSTEIGGFGVSSKADPLLVEDFIVINQTTTAVTVAFDDEAVANYFEDMVAAGRQPAQFARIWIHTHPGSSPSPSGTDEETFARVFGSCDWAVMFILAKGGDTYARLRFNVGPGGHLVMDDQVDFRADFGPPNWEQWQAEYAERVTAEVFDPPVYAKGFKKALRRHRVQQRRL